MKKGDCIIVACRKVMENHNFLFCYAYVNGQGRLKGHKILHAWNELGDVVFDSSNGKSIVMRKEKYYSIAGISEEDVTKQTADETIKLMFKTKSYGGWIK
jgi:hypothetical protein